jgi:hypothetical protein
MATPADAKTNKLVVDQRADSVFFFALDPDLDLMLVFFAINLSANSKRKIHPPNLSVRGPVTFLSLPCYYSRHWRAMYLPSLQYYRISAPILSKSENEQEKTKKTEQHHRPEQKSLA